MKEHYLSMNVTSFRVESVITTLDLPFSPHMCNYLQVMVLLLAGTRIMIVPVSLWAAGTHAKPGLMATQVSFITSFYSWLIWTFRRLADAK